MLLFSFTLSFTLYTQKKINLSLFNGSFLIITHSLGLSYKIIIHQEYFLSIYMITYKVKHYNNLDYKCL